MAKKKSKTSKPPSLKTKTKKKKSLKGKTTRKRVSKPKVRVKKEKKPQKPEIAREVKPPPLEGGEEAADEIIKVLTELSDRENTEDTSQGSPTDSTLDIFGDVNSPIEESVDSPPPIPLDKEDKEDKEEILKPEEVTEPALDEDLNSMQLAILDMAPAKKSIPSSSTNLPAPPPVNEGIKPKKEAKPKEKAVALPEDTSRKPSGLFSRKKIEKDEPSKESEAALVEEPIVAPPPGEIPLSLEDAPPPPPPLTDDKTDEPSIITPPPISEVSVKKEKMPIPPAPADDAAEPSVIPPPPTTEVSLELEEMPIPPAPVDDAAEQSVVPPPPTTEVSLELEEMPIPPAPVDDAVEPSVVPPPPTTEVSVQIEEIPIPPSILPDNDQKDHPSISVIAEASSSEDELSPPEAESKTHLQPVEDLLSPPQEVSSDKKKGFFSKFLHHESAPKDQLPPPPLQDEDISSPVLSEGEGELLEPSVRSAELIEEVLIEIAPQEEIQSSMVEERDSELKLQLENSLENIKSQQLLATKEQDKDHEELQALHDEINELHGEMVEVISELARLKTGTGVHTPELESPTPPPPPMEIDITQVTESPPVQLEEPELKNSIELEVPSNSREIPEYLEKLEEKFSESDRIWSKLQELSKEDDKHVQELRQAVLIKEPVIDKPLMTNEIINIPDSLSEQDIMNAKKTDELAGQYSEDTDPTTPSLPTPPPPPPIGEISPTLNHSLMSEDVQKIKEAVGTLPVSDVHIEDDFDLPKPPGQESIEVPTLLKLPKMERNVEVRKQKSMIDGLHAEIKMLELENEQMRDDARGEGGDSDILSLGLVPLGTTDSSLLSQEEESEETPLTLSANVPISAPKGSEKPHKRKRAKKSSKRSHKKSALKKLHEELLQNKLDDHVVGKAHSQKKRPSRKQKEQIKKTNHKKKESPKRDPVIDKQDLMLKEMREEIVRLRNEQVNMRNKIGGMEIRIEETPVEPSQELSPEESLPPIGEDVEEEMQVVNVKPNNQEMMRTLESLASQLQSYLDERQLDQADAVIDRIKVLKARLGATNIGNLQYELVGLEAEAKLARLT